MAVPGWMDVHRRGGGRGGRVSSGLLGASILDGRAHEPEDQALTQVPDEEGQPADAIQDAQPGQAGEEGDARQEQGGEKQQRSGLVKMGDQLATHQLADTAGDAVGQVDGDGGQQDTRQGAPRRQGEQKAEQAQGQTLDPRLGLVVHAAQGQPGAPGNGEGQQIGEGAEQGQGDVGKPGTDRPAQIAHLIARFDVGPARVLGAVGHETGHQQQRDREQGPHDGLAQDALEVVAEGQLPDAGRLCQIHVLRLAARLYLSHFSFRHCVRPGCHPGEDNLNTCRQARRPPPCGRHPLRTPSGPSLSMPKTEMRPRYLGCLGFRRVPRRPLPIKTAFRIQTCRKAGSTRRPCSTLTAPARAGSVGHSTLARRRTQG